MLSSGPLGLVRIFVLLGLAVDIVGTLVELATTDATDRTERTKLRIN